MQRVQHRGVHGREQIGLVATRVDVFVPAPWRNDEEVASFPPDLCAVDDRHAFATERVMHRNVRVPVRPRVDVGPQHLHAAPDGRKHMSAGRWIDVVHGDVVERIGVRHSESIQGNARLLPWIAHDGRYGPGVQLAVERQHAACAEPRQAGICHLGRHLQSLSVGLLKRLLQIAHERPIERIHPDRRLVRLVDVAVPVPPRRQHQIAWKHLDRFAFDDRDGRRPFDDEADRRDAVAVARRNFARQNELDVAGERVAGGTKARQVRIDELNHPALRVGAGRHEFAGSHQRRPDFAPCPVKGLVGRLAPRIILRRRTAAPQRVEMLALKIVEIGVHFAVGSCRRAVWHRRPPEPLVLHATYQCRAPGQTTPRYRTGALRRFVAGWKEGDRSSPPPMLRLRSDTIKSATEPHRRSLGASGKMRFVWEDAG